MTWLGKSFLLLNSVKYMKLEINYIKILSKDFFNIF